MSIQKRTPDSKLEQLTNSPPARRACSPRPSSLFEVLISPDGRRRRLSSWAVSLPLTSLYRTPP